MLASGLLHWRHPVTDAGMDLLGGGRLQYIRHSPRPVGLLLRVHFLADTNQTSGGVQSRPRWGLS